VGSSVGTRNGEDLVDALSAIARLAAGRL
jgi:hypothetical protein